MKVLRSSCQREAVQFSADVLKLRAQLEESLESISMVRSDNRSLAEKVKSEQISEDECNANELECNNIRVGSMTSKFISMKCFYSFRLNFLH